MAGAANVRAAWGMICLSLVAGAVLGTWSFGGPVAPPAGFEDYAALPRRLVRLAHIAGVMLPVLNLLYVPWMRRTAWPEPLRALGCRLMLVGMIGLPLMLAGAAAWRPLLHASAVPVLALVAGTALLAAGRPDPERSAA